MVNLPGQWLVMLIVISIPTTFVAQSDLATVTASVTTGSDSQWEFQSETPNHLGPVSGNSRRSWGATVGAWTPWLSSCAMELLLQFSQHSGLLDEGLVFSIFCSAVDWTNLEDLGSLHGVTLSVGYDQAPQKGHWLHSYGTVPALLFVTRHYWPWVLANY